VTLHMADFAVEVPEEECCACTEGVYVVGDEQPPFSWCLHHLRQATFILEQTGHWPRIRNQKGVLE
jgi:hypothetical protein